MASPISWPAGLAGTGFDLATASNNYMSGNVLWVDTSPRGDDTNAGTNRDLPVKTLHKAYQNATGGDLIVIEAGSQEAISTSQVFNKQGLSVLGLGQGSNAPRYTANAGIDMFSVQAPGTKFYNLFFPASTATPLCRVKFDAPDGELNTCYFEHGALDTVPGVLVDDQGDSLRLISNTHTVINARPSIGVSVFGGAKDLYVKDATFNGGSYGWTDYAFKVSTSAATRMLIAGITLADSNFGITITGCSYKIFGVVTSGSGRVVIEA